MRSEESPTTGYETLSLPLQRDVDQACDQFENALRTGRQPRAEEYLALVPEAGRAALLRELALVDAHYRNRRRRQRYSLVRLHEDGGIGRVSLQYDGELCRNVAMKELLPDKASDPELVTRFLEEARITGQLEHPGIVPVYELVDPADGKSPFYTMRFVEGRTLTRATRDYHEKRQAGGATLPDLLALLNAFVSVCQTVAYAHSRGVLHRDLKGRNVMLGDFGEVIVLDWGLAKVMTRDADGVSESDCPLSRTGADLLPGQETQFGQVKGTPQYLAPEQAGGQVDFVGPATDVYGLGAVLYEILTDRPPFTGPDVCTILRKVQEEKPLRPSEVVPDVPARLEAACLRALAKKPDDRHASPADLAAEVQQWLADLAQRSRAEQERERFFGLSLDLLCTVGLDDRFEQLNPAWESTLGWSRQELLARPYLDLVHPDDREATRAEAQRIRAGEGRPGFENRYRRKNGQYLWVSWTASLIPGEGLLYAVGRDVTGRKQAEESLRRSQERFELAVRGSGDGLWDWDRETGESYYSPRWKSMLGYEDHELTHDLREWQERLHPEDRERVLAALEAYVAGPSQAYNVEYRMRHKDGSYRWILDRGVALRDAAGVALRMAGSHTDVTERKQQQETPIA